MVIRLLPPSATLAAELELYRRMGEAGAGLPVIEAGKYPADCFREREGAKGEAGYVITDKYNGLLHEVLREGEATPGVADWRRLLAEQTRKMKQILGGLAESFQAEPEDVVYVSDGAGLYFINFERAFGGEFFRR